MANVRCRLLRRYALQLSLDHFVMGVFSRWTVYALAWEVPLGRSQSRPRYPIAFYDQWNTGSLIAICVSIGHSYRNMARKHCLLFDGIGAQRTSMMHGMK